MYIFHVNYSFLFLSISSEREMEIQVEDLNKIKNGEKESITRPSVGMEVERRRAGIPPLETFKFIQSERVPSLMYNKKDIIRTLVLFFFLLFKEQHLHSVGLIHLGTIHCALILSLKKQTNDAMQLSSQ